MSNSTGRSSAGKGSSKPAKPHKDFPLYPHNTGCWAKKVRGKTHYFGTWDDPQAALEEWLAVKDDLLAGRDPQPSDDDDVTVADLCNAFLTKQEKRRDNGELNR